MSVYFLCRKVRAVQTAPSPSNPPPTFVTPSWAVGNNAPPSQAFMLLVDGIGSLSATAQIYVSNDDDQTSARWAPYGDPITATGTALNGAVPMATSAGSQPWRRFTAIITAISGTNASADVKMSA